MNVRRTLDGNTRAEGFCDPQFQPVLDAFLNNFENHDELGASVSLRSGDSVVVDLWGGHAGADRKRSWDRDTVCVVFSYTKAATALCAQLLIDRGALDLDNKVSRYWPEFARAGKEDATVLMMLNHSVGLPALRERLKPGAYYDWDYMTGRLAEEAGPYCQQNGSTRCHASPWRPTATKPCLFRPASARVSCCRWTIAICRPGIRWS